MFLDESAFDLEDNDKAYNRRTSATNNCYSKNPGKFFLRIIRQMEIIWRRAKKSLDTFSLAMSHYRDRDAEEKALEISSTFDNSFIPNAQVLLRTTTTSTITMMMTMTALGCPLLAVPAVSEHRRLVELGCLLSREIFNRRKDFQRIKVEVKRQKTTVHIFLERNDSNSNQPHMHAPLSPRNGEELYQQPSKWYVDA